MGRSALPRTERLHQVDDARSNFRGLDFIERRHQVDGLWIEGRPPGIVFALVGLKTFEEVGGMDLERLGDVEQDRSRDAVLPAFVFLYLLKRDTDVIAQRSLRHLALLT